MPRGTFIQDIINSFDAGAGKKLVRGFLVAIALGVLIGFYVHNQFCGLQRADAMEYAQLGRNLAEGRGFSTRCIRPADLTRVTETAEEAPDGYAFPDVRHAPAYPYLLAAGFKVLRPPFRAAENGIFIPESRVVLPFGIALTVLTGLLVFALARRLFDMTVATTATIVYFVTETVLAYAQSGTPLPLGAFLTVAACHAAVAGVQSRADGQSALRWLPRYLLAAVLAGLAALTLYVLLAVVVAVAVFVAFGTGEKRWSHALLVLIVSAMVVTPWLVRNYRVAGSPFGNAPQTCLTDTGLCPGDSIERDPEPGLRRHHVAYTFRRKVTSRLSEMVQHGFGSIAGGLLVAFFLVSCFHRFESPAQDALRWAVVLALLAITVTAATVGGTHATSPAILIPLLAVFATAFFYALATRQELMDINWYGVMIAAFIGFAGLSSLLRVVGPRARLPYPPYGPRLASGVCDFLDVGDWICTDIPWATAWYGDCPSLLLPLTPAALNDPAFTNAPVGGIYLTSETKERYNPGGSSGSWRTILRGGIPADTDFPYTNAIAIPPGDPDQLFLSKGTPWDL